MRDYGKVSPQFWVGETGKRIRSAGPECQVVALYLMSSPHANMLGLYYLPLVFLSHETGLPLEGASKALESLKEAGFCSYDEAAEVVWVHEMAYYQVGESLKPNDNRVKGIVSALKNVPKNRHIARWWDKYGTAFSLPDEEAPPKPLRSQKQEQEQEQEEKQEKQCPPAEAAEPLDDRSRADHEREFEILWQSFDKALGEKGSKKTAKAQYLKIRPDPDQFQSMLSALQSQIADKYEKNAMGQFAPNFPHVERWLKNRRWEDEISPAVAQQRTGRLSKSERDDAAMRRYLEENGALDDRDGESMEAPAVVAIGAFRGGQH